MEASRSLYSLELLDEVNAIEIMLCDKQESMGTNVNKYIIYQDDKTILNIVNKDNKVIRLEYLKGCDAYTYFGSFLRKDYVEINIYDGGNRKLLKSICINITDMNYKSKLYIIQDKITSMIFEVLDFLLMPNIMCIVVAIFIIVIFKKNVDGIFERMVEIFSIAGN